MLQVVGNLVYYRYINSAIVAPDAFDIVSVAPDQKLNNNQRRNLASIAKILQFAASKKGQRPCLVFYIYILQTYVMYEICSNRKKYFHHIWQSVLSANSWCLWCGTV